MKFVIQLVFASVLGYLVVAIFPAALAQPAPQSSNVNVTAEVISPASPAGGGGGGGGAPAVANVVLKGFTSPEAKVIISQDSSLVAQNQATAAGLFSATVNNVQAGQHQFDIESEDSAGLKSITFSIRVDILGGTITTLSNIFLAPTIAATSAEFLISDTIKVVGQTVPASTVAITFSSAALLAHTPAGADGRFFYSIPAKEIGAGAHSVRAQAILAGGFQSLVSNSVNFFIKESAGARAAKRSDLNKSGKVDLTDLSVLLFNWGTQFKNPAADINKDSRVDLVDLSILLYEWSP